MSVMLYYKGNEVKDVGQYLIQGCIKASFLHHWTLDSGDCITKELDT